MTDCIFCRRETLAIIAENGQAFAVRDAYPVRPLHTLIITKRHVTDVFGTTSEERDAIRALASLCREEIGRSDPTVAGFNFGSNVGLAAGQKIFHAHVHLILRRHGEPDLAGAKPD